MARPINPGGGEMAQVLAMMLEFDERRSEREEERRQRDREISLQERQFQLQMTAAEEQRYRDTLGDIRTNPNMDDIQKIKAERALNRKFGKTDLPVGKEERKFDLTQGAIKKAEEAFTPDFLATPEGTDLESSVNAIVSRVSELMPNIKGHEILALPIGDRVEWAKRAMRQFQSTGALGGEAEAGLRRLEALENRQLAPQGQERPTLLNQLGDVPQLLGDAIQKGISL
jgi:hypothetical protein